MKVLIACEESQIVCIAFREKGHEAYSCDIKECSGGHPARKATCLWLKNLKNLHPTDIVEPEIYSYLAANGHIKTQSRWISKCKNKDRSEFRSKTFLGIAKAMADQWG